VYATSNSGTPIYANASTGNTILASTVSGTAVLGSASSNGTGISGSGGGYGVKGQSYSGIAVNAASTTGYGLYTTSDSGLAIYASSNSTLATIYAVGYGGNTIYGNASYGTGAYGKADSGTGVKGESFSGYGVYGISSYGNGIVAQNNDTTMAAAATSSLAGSSSGLAYYGTGGIMISGNAYKPGGGAWQATSDARLKKDVTPLRLGLEQLRQVRPVTYKYNGLADTTDDGREYVGVIAQELEKVFPSMVSTRKAKLHKDDAASTDIKVVDPSALTFVLINAVKEQQQIIDRQERRIAALERQRGTALSALNLGGGAEAGLALALLPLGFVALRRRKERATLLRG